LASKKNSAKTGVTLDRTPSAAHIWGVKSAILALEDGFVLRGHCFGAEAQALGEVCFNTSMTGYQEVLTDPSYRGQIVAMTYPEIGNYGISSCDDESDQVQVAGFVVRSLSPIVSNWRAELSLEEYLHRAGVAGLCGVDTRALTRHLRTRGALRGVITTESLSDAAATDLARSFSYEGVDFVREVTTPTPYEWDPNGTESGAFRVSYGNETPPDVSPPPLRQPLPPIKYRIAAYDFGIKRNILRRLRQHGFSVKVFPATAPASDLLAEKPDGVFLSNGPGDPSALTYVHENVRALIGKVPLFGICLGHQMIGCALGAKTFKLKFGHRGGNQPVKDLSTGKVAITSQNHGFSVDATSAPQGEIEVTHINLNDGTCEGLRHRSENVFSVQYHPEAAPGPHDATYFFREFAKRIEIPLENR
jgi:carbamoyl-phosphate synthase small subunit